MSFICHYNIQNHKLDTKNVVRPLCPNLFPEANAIPTSSVVGNKSDHISPAKFSIKKLDIFRMRGKFKGIIK